MPLHRTECVNRCQLLPVSSPCSRLPGMMAGVSPLFWNDTSGAAETLLGPRKMAAVHAWPPLRKNWSESAGPSAALHEHLGEEEPVYIVSDALVRREGWWSKNKERKKRTRNLCLSGQPKRPWLPPLDVPSRPEETQKLTCGRVVPPFKDLEEEGVFCGPVGRVAICPERHFGKKKAAFGPVLPAF